MDKRGLSFFVFIWRLTSEIWMLIGSKLRDADADMMEGGLSFFGISDLVIFGHLGGAVLFLKKDSPPVHLAWF